MVVEGEEDESSKPSQPSCPVYEELLGVMDRASGRLQLSLERAREKTARGKLDKQFLSGHNRPAPVSLPFLPDLDTEIARTWKKPYSARIHRHRHANDANVKGMQKHGYVAMPQSTRRSQIILRVGGQ